MAIQTVNVGTTPNDGTGDPARTAFIKINDNFTQPENAASRLVATTAEALAGTPDVLLDAAGGHAAFKQYGLGLSYSVPSFSGDLNDLKTIGFYLSSTVSTTNLPAISGTYAVIVDFANSAVRWMQTVKLQDSEAIRIFSRKFTGTTWTAWVELYHTGNTTVDGNGFIKAASPIASLYNDRAESNGFAELEAMRFERIATGHYRLTGVPELSRDGWYIETPKDRNGNIYFTIDYVDSDGQLDIYTYTPDYSTGRATNGEPVDIVDGRFVSLRFAESPETALPEEA